MAILLANTVWEGISTEQKPDYAAGGRDGHFFKELDTGESYFRRHGVWVYINKGLSFVSATKSGRITTQPNGKYNVVFATPFADDQYTVTLTTQDQGTTKVLVPSFMNLTATGFQIRTRRISDGILVGGIVTSWLATRDYDPTIP